MKPLRTSAKLEQMLFVTGALRTDTTFVSDWITQSKDAYCAHEISREVHGMTDSEILDYLWSCARTGTDRQDKPALHEFVRWPPHQLKTQLKVLGFKEPIFWPVQSGVAPYHVDGFLRNFPTKYVVMLRHPFDVIASGRCRAEQTTTWPGFTVDEHARLWTSSFQLWQRYRDLGYPTLTVRWERLLLRLAKTITRYRTLILNAVDHDLSNARSKATNTHLRLLTRRAYGYRSPNALIAMADLTRGGLCPPLPDDHEDSTHGNVSRAPISPLLANIALHALDEKWVAECARPGVLVRYCDDFVILCSGQRRAEEARRRVEWILSTLGLRLHPDKTRTACLSQGKDGFVFLGFSHRKVQSWKRSDRYFLQKWPSDRNMALIRSKIKAATGRNQVSRPVSVVEGLNPVLRGWGTITTSGGAILPGNSPPLIATMSTSDWPSSPATRKDVEAGTGRNASLTPGSSLWAYIDSAERFATTELRMPDGERCRKAV